MLEIKEKTKNPAIKAFLYKYIPKKLKKVPYFTEVFGRNFANKRIKQHVLVVYTNEDGRAKGSLGYYIDYSITLCCAGEDGRLLTKKDLLTDESKEQTAAHESIHAVLLRTNKECKKNKIGYGTGILEMYIDPETNEQVEIGRGINEGFTEWLCEKAGYKANSYEELKKFVYLIEQEIGTKKTMMLGNGNVRENISKILGMTQKETIKQLAFADELYRVNEEISMQTRIVYLFEGMFRGESEYFKKFKDYKDEIKKIRKSPAFISYFSEKKEIYSKQNEYADEKKILLEYLKEVSLPELIEQRNVAIIQFESGILDKYFMKDINNLIENKEISDKDYQKISKIVSFISTANIEIPEYMKNSEPQMSSITLCEKLEEITKIYLKNKAKEMAEQYKSGKLKFDELWEFKSLSGNENLLIEEFCKNCDPSYRNAMDRILKELNYYKDYKDKILNSSIYILKSPTGEKIENNYILKDSKEFYDFYLLGGNNNKIYKDSKKEVEFDFTIDDSVDNELEITIRNFLELRKKIFRKNPNANIQIFSRIIVVQNGENSKFYYISKGKILPVELQDEHKLNFCLEKNTNKNENKELVPTKVSRLSKISNYVRRRWIEFRKSKKLNSGDDYKEQKSKLDSYKITINNKIEQIPDNMPKR